MKKQKVQNSIYCFLAFAILAIFNSCVKEIDDYQKPPDTVVNDINELEIPSGFKYDIDKTVNIHLRFLTNNDAPLKGIKIRLMSNSPEKNGDIYFTGVTNTNGEIVTSLNLARDINSLIINSNFIGLINNAILNVSGTSATLQIGGKHPATFNVVESLRNTNYPVNNQNRSSSNVPSKNFMGSWNASGVPNYLSSQPDIINADFLDRINNSLPESQPVPTNHPAYVNPGIKSTVVLSQTADISMVFVHEGAGFKNTIGYYTYNIHHPPSSINDISKINIVFPNFSYYNGGGGLNSGDKVYLGTFGQDTVIGFVLLADAYNSNNQTVGNGNAQYYSDNDFNPESTNPLRIHSVTLWDAQEQKLVVGFEDLNRGQSCDNDFNDAIFYLTSNIPNAIHSTNTILTSNDVDSDNDGVSDIMDEYPNDPLYASNSYYPAKDKPGHLAFEDLWPYKGDFDFNDLIVGYKFNCIKNASDMVAVIDADIYVNAVGGSYQNGLGFELPVPQSFIQNVTGTNIKFNYINFNSNGTESAQQNAVIIAFDNALNLVHRPSGYYVNTQQGSPVIPTDTLHIRIKLISPVTTASLGSAPFNPFMISNMRRGYEIHLPDKAPTDLADQTLFNTGNDKSSVALGRYYKSDKNTPWALNIPDEFPIIIEKSQILKAYTKFQSWSTSAGILYPDWYEDKPGYRDNNFILNR